MIDLCEDLPHIGSLWHVMGLSSEGQMCVVEAFATSRTLTKFLPRDCRTAIAYIFPHHYRLQTIFHMYVVWMFMLHCTFYNTAEETQSIAHCNKHWDRLKQKEKILKAWIKYCHSCFASFHQLELCLANNVNNSCDLHFRFVTWPNLHTIEKHTGHSKHLR